MIACLLLSLVISSGSVTGQAASIDFADPARLNSWLRHPVYGDPSFDSFERLPGNPIHRGAPPFEWPVNGFLFEDPRSGNWYVYVGLYAAGYAMGEGKNMACTLYRSEDKGRSWQHVGPIFPHGPFMFDGEIPFGRAPDVSVVYADGRYHMVYDWASANSDWATMMNPPKGVDSGIAYAWADRPEGPFVRTTRPLYQTGAHPFYRRKYRRGYAATLIRRERDWLVLAMMDSGAHHSWALVGMTSPKPEGPYSAPVFLRCVDDMYFHPPLLEFYPAFEHDGWVYSPATSVALNRNFQVMFRAKTEDSMNPGAWEIFQHGSVWHADPVPHEHYGIWGQTFSGFVSADNTLNVMFPSRDREGFGTINLASRPWDRPYRPHGFTLSGHQGPSLTLLKGTCEAFSLETELDLRGECSVLWGYHAPLGPDRPTSNSTLHPLSLTRYCALELAGREWRIVRVGEAGRRDEFASGSITSNGEWKAAISHAVDGRTRVTLNGDTVWNGNIESAEGAVGILVGRNSHLTVTRFNMEEPGKKGRVFYLHTEAILGGGQAGGSWREVEDPSLSYGIGAVSATADARGKWNFEGSGFSIWAPRGTQYGAADVFVDGVKVGEIDFTAQEPRPSSALLSCQDIENTYHAVIVQVKEGIVPLDVIEVAQ